MIGTPIPQWAAVWAQRDGCDIQPRVSQAGLNLSRQQWTGCASGTEVDLYSIVGGKHGWPGGSGEPSVDFDAARMIWDFFNSHPEPQSAPVPAITFRTTNTNHAELGYSPA